MARGGQVRGLRATVVRQRTKRRHTLAAGAFMTESSPVENRPSPALAAALLLVSALFLVFAKDIPRQGLAGNTDPGPRALPVAMALLVGVGGIVELARALRNRPRRFAASSSGDDAPIGAAEDMSYRNFVVLTAAMLLYLVALSWFGFQLSTLLFTAGVLIWLGARWWVAVLASLAMVLVVRVLFVELFHVQLPAGAWGLAI